MDRRSQHEVSHHSVILTRFPLTETNLVFKATLSHDTSYAGRGVSFYLYAESQFFELENSPFESTSQALAPHPSLESSGTNTETQYNPTSNSLPTTLTWDGT